MLQETHENWRIIPEPCALDVQVWADSGRLESGIHHARLTGNVLLDLTCNHGLPAFIVGRCHFFLEVDNGLRWIKTLGAAVCAIHDSMASVQFHCVVDPCETLGCEFITGVSDPPVGLHEDGWAQVILRIPPVGGAGSHAARTENAFVHSVQFSAICDGLVVLPHTTALGPLARECLSARRSVALEPWLDRLVLVVEICEIRHEILDHIRVWERLDLDGFWARLNVHQASEAILTLDVHGTGSTDALTARSAKGKGGIYLILDLDQGIEDHRTTLVEINVVFLHEWFCLLLGVIPVDLESLHICTSREGAHVLGSSLPSETR